MDLKVIFDNCTLLFEYFDWYAILLVFGVFGLMLPLNLIYKKIMKKESLGRLRKVISAVSVYGVSAGLIALFTGLVIKQPITAAYLFGATLPCGFLAQLLWAIIKVIRDYGVTPILKIIAESKEAKAWIVNIGLNESIVDTITTNVLAYLKGVDAKTVEDVIAQEMQITNDLRVKLTGFVKNENDMEVFISKLLEQIKSKYPKQEELKKNKQEKKVEPVVESSESQP